MRYLANGVSFTQGRMTMRLIESSGQRVVYRSPSFTASGSVVRGSFLIV